MRARIGGLFDTQIYVIEDGFLAIEQAFDTVVLLTPDEMLMVIKTLQSWYDRRAQWQEPTRE
ncbi:MAG TPA: hypothetical protein VF322_15335 [Gammaproteobacteria bacterium]